MRKIKEIKSNGYYLFESLSSSRSSYFESNNEVDFFKKLFERYLKKYIRIHRMYLSSEGYQVLVTLRQKSTIRGRYIENCKKRNKVIRQSFVEEVWRIVSEQIRIFHSVYVKSVNKSRGRKGVLVQKRYERFIFSSVAEFEAYVAKMDGGKEISGQEKVKYSLAKKWRGRVSWGVFRGVLWVEGVMDRVFRGFVVSKLVTSTLSLHSPPP